MSDEINRSMCPMDHADDERERKRARSKRLLSGNLIGSSKRAEGSGCSSMPLVMLTAILTII